MPFPGEFAALGTAALWAIGSLLFTFAARRIGTFTLNLVRITLAFLILAAFLTLTRGTAWIPAPGDGLVLLALSGWIGLTLGDWALFGAMVSLGPRLATLLMTLAPPLAAVLAVPLLGERLGGLAVLGMGITLAGVVWVVLERTSGTPLPRGHRIRGVVLGFLGASGQAVGLVLSKIGMGDGIDPLAATAIRMAAAMLGVWLIALVARRRVRLADLWRERGAQIATVGAVVVGPVMGVWLSLIAVLHTQAGIAATLMALTPVLVLPLVRGVHGEPVSSRAVLGALVAVGGVALLFIRS